jgi:peroxiredoxin
MLPAILLSPGLKGQGNHAFVVKGTIKGADSKTITLLNVDNNKKTDAFIIRNDHFELKGSANGLSVFALSLQDAAYPLLIVGDDNDTLEINTTLQDFPKAKVKGNAQSIAMQQYQREFYPLMQQAQEINRQAATIHEGDSAAITSLQQQADTFNQQMRNTGIAFIQYHPRAIASIFVLMNEMHNMAPRELQSLLNAFPDTIKNTRYWKMATLQINMMAATAIGADAPAFTMNDVHGNPVSLSSFHGKYVLVDFWASWCGPCRAENPNVVKAYEKYKDKNFTVLGVSLDKSRSSWINAIQQDGLQWTQVSDLGGWGNAAAQLYHVYSIPANFLLDPSGKIIAKNLRGRALEQKLNEVLH